MATSTERTKVPPPASAPEGGPPEDRGTRRLLFVLLGVLVLGAIALLVLLVWLLRPAATAESGATAGGYPIQVVTTIYGYGDEPNELVRTPLGVTFDPDGNVWLSNTGQARVEQYTSDGTYIRTVGADGPGKLYSPYGLAVDAERGRLYVADYGAGAIQVFSTEGGYVTHFPADDQDLEVFGPDGFAPFDVNVAGGRVVVASHDGLYFFDETGHVVGRWGYTQKGANVRGVELGMFNFPDAFDIDPQSGRFYVADSLNRRIVAIDRQGKWLWVSGRPDSKGKIRGFWQLPRGIAVGADGNIYVVDTFRYDDEGMGAGHIVVLSPDGELLSEFGRTGTEDGSFRFPEQLESGPDGLWALADRENHRVVIFRLLTPYPDVDELEQPRYEGMLELPSDVWSTPAPPPAPAG